MSSEEEYKEIFGEEYVPTEIDDDSDFKPSGVEDYEQNEDEQNIESRRNEQRHNASWTCYG